MAAFKKNPKAKPGQDPDPAVAFEESRAIWRDSLALVQSVPGVGQRSRMLDWVNDLIRKGILRRAETVPLELFGMSADRASVLLWRHERLPLPLMYLDDKDLLDKLGVALSLAERAGSALNRATRLLATLLLAPESDQPEARQPTPEDLSRLVSRLAPGRAYWADLELRFKRFLVDLAEDSVPGDGDRPVYGVHTLPRWAGEVERTARTAFQDTVRGLDSSARTLKAVAVAERRLRLLLHETLEDATGQREGEAA
jgi:CRISPR system Cascade subunit CasA